MERDSVTWFDSLDFCLRIIFLFIIYVFLRLV